MTAGAIAIRNVGLVTSLGLSAPSTCAALRAGINNASLSNFHGGGAEPVSVHRVPLERAWSGRGRLCKMLAMALTECLQELDGAARRGFPLLLCVAERERTGRFDGLEDQLFGELQDELELGYDAERSGILPLGRLGALAALGRARSLIRDQGAAYVIVAAADSLLSRPTLSGLERQGRLLTENNSDGFIPGEGAGAVLLTGATGSAGEVACVGLGAGIEPAPWMSGEPLRAAGLTAAIRSALNEAGLQIHDLDFRISDISGEQYYFKEASLAIGRLLRRRKEEFDLWHPAEGIGEAGAPASVAMIAVAWMACRKGYARGPRILLHAGCDGAHRAAAIFQHVPVQ